MAVQLRKSGALQSINLTPLIDVVFLLLIFFLVASRIADEEPQLELDLPDINAALPASFQPNELIVSVDAAGRMHAEGAFRTADEVRELIRTAHTNNPLTQTVIIRGDRRADWEQIANLIAICREVGIQQYSATTSDGE